MPVLPFQDIDLIYPDRFFIPIKRDDYPQADGCLGGGHYDNENSKNLSGQRIRVASVLQITREGDEVQIRRVQDQLDGHEDDDYVSPRQNSRYADDEEHGANHQELGEVGMLKTFQHQRGAPARRSLEKQIAKMAHEKVSSGRNQ